MSRKILERVPAEKLQNDLEKYRQRAFELGTTDARIITADMVLIDERVRAKCINPKCPWYGTNSNCPPHATDLEHIRNTVNNFHYGILTMLKVQPEVIAGPHADINQRKHHLMKNHEIVAKIDAEAFYDGYHLAVGFAAGPCKPLFCPHNECSALTPGQGCKHPLKVRASMEGVGMDTYAMAARAGWDIFPIGQTTPPSEVPHGTLVGLVLIY